MMSYVFKIISIIYPVLLISAMPVLWFFVLYHRRYRVSVDNILLSHDKCSQNISCTFKITNLSKPPFAIKKIYIKPKSSSYTNKKRKYLGKIQSTNNLPIVLSSLDPQNPTVTFPIDLSEFNDNDKSYDKSWILILKTNRLTRRFKASPPH